MKEDQFNIETLIVAILVMLTIINIDVVHVTEAQSVKIEIETEEDIPIVLKNGHKEKEPLRNLLNLLIYIGNIQMNMGMLIQL